MAKHSILAVSLPQICKFEEMFMNKNNVKELKNRRVILRHNNKKKHIEENRVHSFT